MAENTEHLPPHEPTGHDATTRPDGNPARVKKKRINPRRLLIIIASTYLVVVMFVGLLQSKLIYFPSKVIEATPSDVGLAFQDVKLTTADGVAISAWFVPCDGADTTVLFFHGNAGNNSHRVAELKTLHYLGFNTLIVDYRGYGLSQGHPGERGTYLDADAAWKYLTETRRIPANRIVIFGESLGGAVAIDLASRVSPGALVAQSTFTSLADVGSIHYPLLPVGLILQHRYESINKVGRITCPKLFIHTTDDSLIPLSNGKRLFEAAAPPKEFMQTPGEHNSGGFMYTNEHAAQMKAFIENVV